MSIAVGSTALCERDSHQHQTSTPCEAIWERVAGGVLLCFAFKGAPHRLVPRPSWICQSVCCDFGGPFRLRRFSSHIYAAIAGDNDTTSAMKFHTLNGL